VVDAGQVPFRRSRGGGEIAGIVDDEVGRPARDGEAQVLDLRGRVDASKQERVDQGAALVGRECEDLGAASAGSRLPLRWLDACRVEREARRLGALAERRRRRERDLVPCVGERARER
jgi:hypothetical protein